MVSLLNKALIVFIITCLSISTFASSSGGSYGSSNRSGDLRQNRKPVDQRYELGKAVYQGKQGNTKHQYCVDNGTDKVKLKSKTAKSFKNKAANEFAIALYHCDQPDTQIAATLSQQNLFLVIYYLNKRYRLKLEGI